MKCEIKKGANPPSKSKRGGGFLRKIRNLYVRSDRFISLLVGMRSYDKYVEHIRTKHPDREPLSRREFFKEALEARYSGGVNRCC